MSPHEAVRVKEKGLDRYLNYDPYRRACMIEHFLGPQEKESFASALAAALGEAKRWFSDLQNCDRIRGLDTIGP